MSFLVKGFTSWYAGKIGSRLSKLGASLWPTACGFARASAPRESRPVPRADVPPPPPRPAIHRAQA